MEHVALYGRGEVCKGFWWGNIQEGHCLEDLGVGVRMIIKFILKIV